MPDHSELTEIIGRITAERAKALMVALARAPSPQTELMEAEPKLREFIDTAMAPRLKAMGLAEIGRDREGNLFATYGLDRTGRSLMFVTHAMNQPAATMPNPYGGEVRDGKEFGLAGEIVLGKGLSEQKATMAAMLLAVETVLAAKVPIAGKLVFLCCLSGETGRHDALRSLIEGQGMRAEMAVMAGTSNQLSLGNRGRVDVHATIHGSPCHSSRPHDGCNAVTGAMEVIRLVSEGLRFTASHPHLGTPSLAVNRIRSFPDSTHTIQDRCEVTFDRRLLPGEDPDAAVAEIAALAKPVDGMADPASGKPFRVGIAKGAVMYPSLVTVDSPVVRAVFAAAEATLGAAPETYYSSTAFDQGYLNHVGIQCCNFGSGEYKFAHTDFDLASVDRTRDAARVYAAMILQRLT